MSWLDQITSGDRWRADPTGTAARALACTIGAPFCIAGEVAERAGAEGERVRREVMSEIDATRDSLPGLIEQSSAGAERVLNAASAPLDRASSIMMWVAIALGIVAALIVVGVIVYFAWPFLVTIRGGVR